MDAIQPQSSKKVFNIKAHWQAARRKETAERSQRYARIPRGQQKAIFLKFSIC